jgi:hypothetical protein
VPVSTPAEFVYQPVKVGAREGDIAVLEIVKSLRDYTFRRPLNAVHPGRSRRAV